MHSIRFVAIAGAAFAVATTALPFGAAMAKEKTPKSDQQEYRVVKQPDGKVLYCTTQQANTGSRIPQQVCNTAKQWKAEGVTLNTGGNA